MLALFRIEPSFTCCLGIFQLASTIWVLVDSMKFDRELPEERVQPWLWFLGCFCLWIVVFPIYVLVSRPGYARALEESQRRRQSRQLRDEEDRPNRWAQRDPPVEFCPVCGRKKSGSSILCPHCNTKRERQEQGVAGLDPGWDEAIDSASGGDAWESRGNRYRCTQCDQPMHFRTRFCPHCNADQHALQAPYANAPSSEGVAEAGESDASKVESDTLQIPPADPDAPRPPKV